MALLLSNATASITYADGASGPSGIRVNIKKRRESWTPDGVVFLTEILLDPSVDKTRVLAEGDTLQITARDGFPAYATPKSFSLRSVDRPGAIPALAVINALVVGSL